MTQIEAIRARHSVRAYQPKPLDAEKRAKLEAFLAARNAESGLHLQLTEAGKTFQRLISRAAGLSSAPYVIACVGPDTPTLEERVGYYGEQAVLYAQTLGLNTCWAGLYSEKGVPADVGPGERLVLVIALGYGVNGGRERRSKTPEQVSDGGAGEKPEWFRFGVELALLAPTAMNQQKFRFRLNADGSVDAEAPGGPFTKVDLGIARLHFDLGAQSLNPDYVPKRFPDE